MLIVLSPAKTLDYQTPSHTATYSKPDRIHQSAQLVESLKTMSPAQVATLMGVSDALADLNAHRFAAWSTNFTPLNAKQAVLAFNGDVYEGLDARSLNEKQLAYMQSHVRILSGLHGVLRPLDLMQPYRLEMGTKLNTAHAPNLYKFWGDTVTTALGELIVQNKSSALVNLASEKYFKVVQTRQLNVPVITPIFEDRKNGRYKVISFYAKQARGMMARYAAVKAIKRPQQLKKFNMNGYVFDAGASSEFNWVFRRHLES